MDIIRFNNVKSIHLIYHTKQLKDKEDVEKLQKIFSSLIYEETEQSLLGVMGGLLMEVAYEDNSVIQVGFTSKLLSVGGKTYKVSRNICPEVRELFS